jgi:hypothetical protein
MVMILQRGAREDYFTPPLNSPIGWQPLALEAQPALIAFNGGY